MTAATHAPQPSVSAARAGGKTRRPWWKPALFHGLGLLGTVFVGLVTYVEVDWLFIQTAICADEPTIGHRADLITGIVGLGLMAAVLPGVLALVAWRRHFAWRPWAALAGVVFAGTAVLAMRAMPLHDCFV